MAEVALREGVAAECLYKERSSYDTIGNALFSLVDFSAPRAWRRLLVYTNRFHLERTRAAFEWVYGSRGSGGPYELEFVGVEDIGLRAEALHARELKEAKSIASLADKVAAYASLAEIHEFVHQDHSAYCVRDQDRFGMRDAGVSDAALDSY